MNEGAFYFEFRPQQWPPNTPHRLHRIDRDGSIVDLVCFADGHFALIIEFKGERKEYHFQRVSIQDGGIVKLAFSWNRDSAYAAAGGEILTQFNESGGQVLDLKIKGNVSYEMGHISVSPDTLHNTSSDEWLFLETLGDVTRKLTSGSRYDLVRLSALLRQILCDNPPLALKVNSRFKLKLVFEVESAKQKQSMPKFEAEELLTNWSTLYPNTQEETVSINLNQFLQMKTITHKGVECTVGDVIDVVAHAFGGVHLGKLKDKSNQTLSELEKEVLIYDNSVVLLSLLDIAKVTVKSLIPLAEAILRQQDTTNSAVTNTTLP